MRSQNAECGGDPRGGLLRELVLGDPDGSCNNAGQQSIRQPFKGFPWRRACGRRLIGFWRSGPLWGKGFGGNYSLLWEWCGISSVNIEN